MAASSDDSDEILQVVSKSDRLKRDVPEGDGTIREMSDRSEVTREISANGEIQEISHSGCIKRTVSRGMKQHNISYQFTVLNLDVKESRGFQAYFDTECEILPTSWLCEMLFLKVTDDNSACIAFKLKRTDSARDAVGVRVSLDIKDLSTVPLFCYPTLVRESVHPDELIDGNLIRKFQTAEEVSYFNTKLYVNVYISVVSCHFELDGKPINKNC